MITIEDIAEAFRRSKNTELQNLGQETLDRLAAAKQFEFPVQIIRTEDTPHSWSSGPLVSSLHSKTFGHYESLTAAREDAQDRHVGGHTKATRNTGFGIIWDIPR